MLVTLFIILSLLTGEAAALLTEADEGHFRKGIPWLNWRQAYDAYQVEHLAADVLGKNSAANPNRLKFYPENRILANHTVVLFCLLTPDKVNGYRTNRISLHILQEGHVHRLSLLAPTRKLINYADQLDCWNYAQESVCQPLRDCNNPSQPDLRSVGIITKEGWGIFQVTAGKLTQAHYQCVSEMQSVLTSEERSTKQLKEYVTLGSDVEPLQVFQTDIGEPKLTLKPAYNRGLPLSAKCTVENSSPGSAFTIDLVLLRPPPIGSPGANRHELLAREAVPTTAAEGVLNWVGELALLSHHGLGLLCTVSSDWGRRKGKRVQQRELRVQYMFPVYLDNPRIRNVMASVRRMSNPDRYYSTPDKIMLRKAEYVVCKADGYPTPKVEWHVTEPGVAWILNETMFIRHGARAHQIFKAKCLAENGNLDLTDTVTVAVEVLSSHESVRSSLTFIIALLIVACCSLRYT